MRSRPYFMRERGVVSKGISAIVFLVFLGTGALPAMAGVPDWVRAAAQQPVKKYADDVNAVVLLTESETTVKDTGETVTRVRRVIRVLRPDGRDRAYQS